MPASLPVDEPAAPESEAVLAPLEMYGVRLGLERMRRLLAILGDPQATVPTVLVAGTNGKGSTAALLAAIGRAAGYRTGLYTSPHLEAVTERVVIDGAPVADTALADELRALLAEAATAGLEPPTYFEVLTVAALRLFARAGVELAVLEVGLGGRLDATNVSAPAVSVVTAIGLDHEKELGSTVAAVAREKAGIFRRGRPAVVWGGEPAVRDALAAAAAATGAELTVAADEVAIAGDASASPPQNLRVTTPRAVYDVALALAGRHQRDNLAVAVRAAEVMATHGWPAIDAAAITAGVAATRWPGRLERWYLARDTGDRHVLLDAAHNPAGAAVLAAHLAALGTPFDLLFGALGDKRVPDMLPRLAAGARHVTLTLPPSARAGDPGDWLALLPEGTASVEPDADRALDRALQAATGATLVVAGSIYLVGAARRRLRRLGAQPTAAGASSA